MYPSSWSTNEGVRHSMRVRKAEPGEDNLLLVRLAVSVLIREIEHLGSMGNIDTVLVRDKALRDSHLIGKNMEVPLGLLGGVLDNQNLICAFCLALIKIAHFLKRGIIIKLSFI